MQSFCRLDASIFESYRVQSKANNTIALIVKLKHFVDAFKSVDKATQVTLKLSKAPTVSQIPSRADESEERDGNEKRKMRGRPILTLNADLIQTGLQVTQEIPILRLLMQSALREYREPRLPPPTVTISCPEVKHMKQVLERMKTLDKYVQLTVSTPRDCSPEGTGLNEEQAAQGALILKVETEMVSLRTFYQKLNVEDLSIPTNDSASGELNSPKIANKDRFELQVDLNIKELLAVLHFSNYVLRVEKVLLCLIEHKACVIFLSLQKELGCLTYYIPLVIKC